MQLNLPQKRDVKFEFCDMLQFRSLELKDLSDLSEYVEDSLVTKYLTWNSYKDKLDIQKYIQSSQTKNDFPDEVLAVLFKDKVIGTVHIIYRKDEFIQVGFGVISKLWNKGFGTQIFKILLEYIDNSKWALKTNKIVADVHKDNIYAIRIIRKYNFIFEKKLNDNRIRYTLKI